MLCRKNSAGNLREVTKYVWECASKGIKMKLSPKYRRQCKNVCSAACFSNNSVFQTAKGTDVVTLRVCRRCNNAVWSLCRENNECCSSGPLVQAQCLLASPAILVSCWELRSCVPDAGPELAQVTEKQVGLGYCQGKFCVCLLLQAGSVWERTSGFSSHVLGCSRFGCLVTQAAHCLPYNTCVVRYRCPLSLSHFAPEAAQHFGYFLSFIDVTIMSLVTSTTLPFFLSLIFSSWSLVVKRRHQEIKLCSN